MRNLVAESPSRRAVPQAQPLTKVIVVKQKHCNYRSKQCLQARSQIFQDVNSIRNREGACTFVAVSRTSAV